MAKNPLGVCIVSQAFNERKIIEPSVFEKAGGYKVKVALKSSADLIFSKSGHVVAFDVITIRELVQEQSSALARIDKLGSTFKDAFAIICMQQRTQHKSNIFQAASCRRSGKPVMLAIPSEIDLAMLVLKLTENHVAASAGGMLEQGDFIAQGQTAIKNSLMSIPGLNLSEHQASALCMLGSLQHIASSSVADILDATDLEHSQAQRIVSFFQHPDKD